MPSNLTNELIEKFTRFRQDLYDCFGARQEGKQIWRPMWLSVFGQRRHQLTAEQSWQDIKLLKKGQKGVESQRSLPEKLSASHLGGDFSCPIRHWARFILFNLRVGSRVAFANTFSFCPKSKLIGALDNLRPWNWNNKLTSLLPISFLLLHNLFGKIPSQN